MEEKVLEALKEIDEEILEFKGDDLFEAGLLDSFLMINLVVELEEVFKMEIDAKYVVRENFRTTDTIIALMRKLTKKAHWRNRTIY